MSPTNTIDVDLETTRRTDDLPAEYTQVVRAPQVDRDEVLEDGLALEEEIKRYGARDSGSFTELDEFFSSLE